MVPASLSSICPCIPASRELCFTIPPASLILDKTVTPSFSLVNGGWYFIAYVIEPTNKKFTYVIGDRDSGEVFVSDVLTFTGILNTECVADLVMGMHAGTYYYAGGFDDWFLDCDSDMTADDLVSYFLGSLCANGGDMSGSIDALTEPALLCFWPPMVSTLKRPAYDHSRHLRSCWQRQNFRYQRIHCRRQCGVARGNLHFSRYGGMVHLAVHWLQRRTTIAQSEIYPLPYSTDHHGLPARHQRCWTSSSMTFQVPMTDSALQGRRLLMKITHGRQFWSNALISSLPVRSMALIRWNSNSPFQILSAAIWITKSRYRS